MANTLSDIGIWADAYKRRTGRWGIDEEAYGWLQNHLGGRLFRIGRLQCCPARLKQQWNIRVFRSKETGAVIALPAEKTQYRGDGQVSGTNGISAEADGFLGFSRNVVQGGKEYVEGTVLSPLGHALPEVVRLKKEQTNLHLTLKCSFVDELKIDQSIAHNGVCLTVVSIQDGTYTVTAIEETLERSNLGLLKVGDKVNVERSMMMNGRLDGHIVQGHVDQTAECISIQDVDGSRYYTFKYKFDKEMAKRGYMTVDKGSVTVNGVSLTVCNPTDDTFQVAIIPYTYEHTNFHTFQSGSIVNIEFDIIGKYLSRMMQFNN